MAQAAEESIGQIHADFTGDLHSTTEGLRAACQYLLNSALLGRQNPKDRAPQKEAIKAGN